MTDNGAGWRKSTYSGNNGGDCIEVGTWRKSSHSGNNGGNCVEVGSAQVGVMVRDTTDRAGAVLSVSVGAWQALLTEVRVSR
jgi:hypothetical protein